MSRRPSAPVPVEERVDGLELIMDQGQVDQHGQRRSRAIDVLLQVVHPGLHLRRGGRHESGLGRVLAVVSPERDRAIAELARPLASAPHALHEHLVDLLH